MNLEILGNISYDKRFLEIICEINKITENKINKVICLIGMFINSCNSSCMSNMRDDM